MISKQENAWVIVYLDQICIDPLENTSKLRNKLFQTQTAYYFE